MPTYDSNLFDPPAPVAVVSIQDPSSGNTVRNVPMLIDCGSDITLVPQTSINKLGSKIDLNDSYELEGFDGHRSVAKSVRLNLVFLGRTFRGRFVVVNSQSGILGRNVLNHFALLLDGPGLSWELSDSVK
jgi:hypothetical protein